MPWARTPYKWVCASTKPGREGLTGRVDDFILRVCLPQLGVGRDGNDLVIDHAHAPTWLRRLAGEVDEPIWQEKRA